MLTFILQPYSRVNTENPYPILDLFPDLLMLTGLRKVLRLNFSSNSLVLRKMIPYSRPKLADFYTLFLSKLAENHTLHSGTYLYSSYMGPPPPPGLLDSINGAKLCSMFCTSLTAVYNFSFFYCFLSDKTCHARFPPFLSCLANYIIARLWTSVIKKIERSEREKESCY